MNYTKVVKWIFNRLPIYQKYGYKCYKPGLNRIKSFCNYLGNPQKYFKSIHVGGTNGKGSTVNMLYSILQEEGYKVGSFTSPHLLDFRERISYNGKYIEKKFIIKFIEKNQFFIEKKSISFFELNTAMAFQYFKEKKVDLAVIEVGMGGRLDSTNIIIPELSIITNISMDHMEILGKNELEIAFEKSGIIKKNVSVIIGPNNSKTIQYFFLIDSFKKNSPIYFVFPSKKDNLFQSSFDDVNYQYLNKELVLKTIDILKNRKNFFISKKSIIDGLNNIKKNTSFKGRWEILKKKNPRIICDVAHNEKGIYMINSQLNKESYERLHLVLGFVKGKKINSFLNMFSYKKTYLYFCQPNIERKYDIQSLKILVNNFFLKNQHNNKNINFFKSVKMAFISAKKNAKNNDIILISGSTFVVSEVFLLL
ncbi:bifunctional folylpolyglutamate synthase/dihydrofolate synthase [Blattabacterium cuenoti]|uniref:bifunctional folylpolyglutamate synthase/dihydrofolate synthase n=1 Tax=Blattabacterium cuenoti TaxID=1653831 RepID=UPI00163BD40C|nr:Mur ligase family protein [Blattabacterium cuenoti]